MYRPFLANPATGQKIISKEQCAHRQKPVHDHMNFYRILSIKRAYKGRLVVIIYEGNWVAAYTFCPVCM